MSILTILAALAVMSLAIGFIGAVHNGDERKKDLWKAWGPTNY